MSNLRCRCKMGLLVVGLLCLVLAGCGGGANGGRENNAEVTSDTQNNDNTDGNHGEYSTVPAVECPDPTEVRLNVQEFEFPIVCGCEEAPWDDDNTSKTCTISKGMTVVWAFVGSEAHDVKSVDGGFDSSGSKSHGKFTVTFDDAGSKRFMCAKHPGTMRDYTIDVVE